MMNKCFFYFLFFIFYLPVAHAQTPRLDHDTSYYRTYRDRVTARAYLSRKYTALRFDPPGSVPDFDYHPNTSLNLGIGATYHAFTLNIGFGVNRFNPEEIRGKTRYLDLQGHFYARKWNIDLLGEFYRGYYLTPKGLAAPAGEDYYKRNDLKLDLIGVAFYRSLNDRRFSYQAGLLQNEWQKQSAGSILVGGEIYYGSIHADSALVPGKLDTSYRKLNIDKLHFFEIGPGIGYAYTLVVKQHFFLLASVTINLAVRLSAEISHSTGKLEDQIDFTPNHIVHVGLGYNTENWCLSTLWVNTRINAAGITSNYQYGVATGNYRLIFAKRLRINRKVRKILEPIPTLIGK
ncbi:MAG: DUF4421 domain-containing protein [Bacteroidota bacterium]|nr:DUF4421 domain-containing protein [Bacteroidota bacterium]MDP4213565.1 DUF4421 domain-containing protein [Bacteroidota bacterium]MDP4249527.1 DUF4421 domain-containing protein [Bacteroidota bacterium]